MCAKKASVPAARGKKRRRSAQKKSAPTSKARRRRSARAAAPASPSAASAAAASVAAQRIFNCIRSVERPGDIVFSAASSTLLAPDGAVPANKDYRDPAWPVGDQGKTGACVGWAVGDGLLRWHFTQSGDLAPGERLSVRYLWMASKEMDKFDSRPTTFLEDAGTEIRTALAVAHDYGVVRENVLPMQGGLFAAPSEQFFALAGQMKAEVCTPIDKHVFVLQRWLARQGPIAARLLVDRSFLLASPAQPLLSQFVPLTNTFQMGHAVTLVGYLTDPASGLVFIIRNSWGTGWGDNGFALATADYLMAAFNEFFGIFR
ncbi:MAG: C1 family peptidase [Planctomycetaceae bacterium]|nr:C1 family peptidase [Planctomycetaceae bacterium]